MDAFKAFLKKNSFVTVLAVAIVITLANFLIFPIFINNSAHMVQVPVAKERLEEGTFITSDLLTKMSIQKSYLPAGVVTDKEQIIGKYVGENFTVSEGGMFYTDTLSDRAVAVGSTFRELKEGEWAYVFPVEAMYNLNGNIKAGSQINVYFEDYTRARDEFTNAAYDAPIFGLLAENVRVISVSNDNKYLTVALGEEQVALFTMAQRIGDIFPLVYYGSGTVDENGMVHSAIFSTEDVKSWIYGRSYVLSNMSTSAQEFENSTEGQEQTRAQESSGFPLTVEDDEGATRPSSGTMTRPTTGG